MKNKIPEVMKSRCLSLTELHRKTKTLSWPTVQYLAGKNAPENLPEGTWFKTLFELSVALDCSIYDLIEVAE